MLQRHAQDPMRSSVSLNGFGISSQLSYLLLDGMLRYDTGRGVQWVVFKSAMYCSACTDVKQSDTQQQTAGTI